MIANNHLCVKSLILIAFMVIVLVVFAAGEENTPDKEPQYLAVINARLIDGTGAPPLENMTIIIAGERFKEIGLHGEVSIPEGCEIIDAAGKTVIPGLIDTHIHFTYPPEEGAFLEYNASSASFHAAQFLNSYLMVGVTTVRDVCAFQDVGITAKKAFQKGLFTGSRPIVVGQGITCTGGHGTEGTREGIVVEVDGPAEFRRAVRQQLKNGADLIKVLPPYSREEIKAAVEETHAWEKFVTVHSGVFERQFDFVRWAVEDGADCIEHAYAIPDEVIREMGRKGIYCVPTLSVLVTLAEQTKKRGPEWEWKVQKYLECIEIFKKMRRAEVKMGVGTDYVGENMEAYPMVYFDEVEKFVEYGATPMEAIVAATKINSEICDASEEIGTIEKGKLADLLVLEQDPLRDIKNLKKVGIIIQAGKIVKK